MFFQTKKDSFLCFLGPPTLRQNLDCPKYTVFSTQTSNVSGDYLSLLVSSFISPGVIISPTLLPSSTSPQTSMLAALSLELLEGYLLKIVSY